MRYYWQPFYGWVVVGKEAYCADGFLGEILSWRDKAGLIEIGRDEAWDRLQRWGVYAQVSV